MTTAIVSPMARPMASTALAMMPDMCRRVTIPVIICHCVAPMASEPSRSSRGTARMESSDMLMIVGRIMIARITPPARTPNPLPSIQHADSDPPSSRQRHRLSMMNGTRMISPNKPYRTDGIAGQRIDGRPQDIPHLQRSYLGDQDRTAEAQRHARTSDSTVITKLPTIRGKMP